MNVLFQIFTNYSLLIIIQLILGKKGAFLYALLLHMNLYLVSLVIIISDLLLMVLVSRLFQVSLTRVFPFTLLQNKAVKIEQQLKQNNWGEKLIRIGQAGTLIITAIPFAGGVWSGIALAKILQLTNKQTYWLTGIGSVIGCIFFLFAALGIIKLI